MIYPVCSVLQQNCLQDFTRLAFWRFSITYPRSNNVQYTVLLPTLGYVVGYSNLQASIVASNYRASIMKRIYPSNSSFCTFTSHHQAGPLQISVHLGEAPDFADHFQPKLGHVFPENSTSNEVMVETSNDSSKSPRDPYRRKRRKKVHGNKGRVPWNKGRKHTAETRGLIKQRTLEALRDPQVRKKMAEHPHPHSDDIKKKIGSSLRRLWDKRLKWKRLREKFFLSWTNSIAEIARKGGIGQQELDWDSYDMMREEIIQEKLQCALDRAKAKELSKITAEQAAQAKAQKMAKVAQNRKEQKERAKAKEETKRKAYMKSKKKEDELSAVRELTLKHRLTMIRKKKPIDSQVITEGEALVYYRPFWKKLDVEIMKREKGQRKFSLADQIRAAKNQKIEPSVREAVAEPYREQGCPYGNWHPIS